MLVLLTIALLVAIYGVVRPFKGFERKHFGMAAAALFVACLIVTPSPDGNKTPQSGLGATTAPASDAEKAVTGTPAAISSSNPRKDSALEEAGAIIENAEEESLTGPQRNAVRSAEQYLSFAGFSRQGLIDQLSSDAGNGYSVSDATAAVDSLTVDWNENAAKSARQYLEMTGFSCKGLIEQLSSSAGNKYTVAQATYGARAAGAC